MVAVGVMVGVSVTVGVAVRVGVSVGVGVSVAVVVGVASSAITGSQPSSVQLNPTNTGTLNTLANRRP
jgi:hypothetical protein